MQMLLIFFLINLFLREDAGHLTNDLATNRLHYITANQIISTDYFLKPKETYNRPDFSNFALHPDGDLYALKNSGENKGIFRVDPKTGEANMVSDFSNFGDMTFLNTKDLVLVNDTRLVVLDLENDTRRYHEFENYAYYTGGVTIDPGSGNILVTRIPAPFATTILELDPSDLNEITSTTVDFGITDIAFDENNIFYGLIRSEVHAIHLQANSSIRVIAQTAEELFSYTSSNSKLQSISPSLHFGKVESGTAASVNIPVINNGADNLAIDALEFVNEAFTIDVQFPLDIPAGGSLDLPVTFHPTEDIDYEEIIYLNGTYENADWLDSVNLSGKGFIFNAADAETLYGISERSLFKIDPVTGVSEELSQLRYIPDAITQTAEDTMYMVSKGVLYKVDPITGGLDGGRVLIPGLDKINNHAFRTEITSITSAPGKAFYIVVKHETMGGQSSSYSSVLHKYDYLQDSLYRVAWLGSDFNPILAKGAAFHIPSGNVYLSYSNTLYIYKSKDSVLNKVGEYENMIIEDMFFDKNHQLYGSQGYDQSALIAINRHNAKTFTVATLDRRVQDATAGDLSELAGTFPDYIITALPTITQENILVFPNPFMDVLEIKLKSPYKNFSLTIFDLSGKQILRKEYSDHSSTSISWTGTDKQGRQVAPGAYILQIGLPEKQMTFKVLKNR